MKSIIISEIQGDNATLDLYSSNLEHVDYKNFDKENNFKFFDFIEKIVQDMTDGDEWGDATIDPVVDADDENLTYQWLAVLMEYEEVGDDDKISDVYNSWYDDGNGRYDEFDYTWGEFQNSTKKYPTMIIPYSYTNVYFEDTEGTEINIREVIEHQIIDDIDYNVYIVDQVINMFGENNGKTVIVYPNGK